MPNGTYGGVRGGSEFPLLDFQSDLVFLMNRNNSTCLKDTDKKSLYSPFSVIFLLFGDTAEIPESTQAACSP